MRFAVPLVLLLAAGCAGTPDFSSQKILHTRYDGNADDLLTAGLGKSGLGLAQPPAVRDAKSPTLAELRRRAIQLPRPGRHEPGRRLRRPLRPERRPRG